MAGIDALPIVTASGWAMKSMPAAVDCCAAGGVPLCQLPRDVLGVF